MAATLQLSSGLPSSFLDNNFRMASSYDVFLSFRGEDTRKNITDRLYEALKRAGIYTFRDDNGIERGENIKSELQKAIQYSRISIVVFSRNYANSGWCLDELALILKRYKSSGHLILPVFYHVDKFLFTTQSGSVAEAFAGHEERIIGEKSEEKRKEGFERMKGWRAALQEVAEMGGITLKSQANHGEELKFIEKVVTVIEDKLSRTTMDGVPELVGMRGRTDDIRLWLKDHTTDVAIYVLSGMGGIGKTTIAKFIYNLYANSFQGSSFLANIREKSEEHDGIVHLQKQLLSDILKEKNINLSCIDEGIGKIKDALSSIRVLLVFDDVDQPYQMNEILGMREGLCPGSKIIVTTRKEWLPLHTQAYKIDKVEVLNRLDSMELFSWHAFGQGFPFEGYLQLSNSVIKLCEGLPLAIRVLGSSLAGKSPDIWKSIVEKLEVIPNNQILKKLTVSYDTLQDKHDRSLFLHISCFFCGMDKYVVTNILDDCGYFTEVGIQNLTQRCLLEVDERNKLVMHHVLRDMGRGIVRQESPRDPGRRSRIWHPKDSLNVLREKTGTEAVEGIIFDIHVSTDHQQDCSRRDSNTEYLRSPLEESISSRCRYFDFRSWDSSTPSNSCHMKYFDTNSFAMMKNLKLLKLNNVQLTGHFNELPKRLRWLSWHHCPLKSIPRDFPLHALVVIDLRYSGLEQMWKGVKFLGSAKVLNLSHSWQLRRTPDLSGLPKLEKLILKDCASLIKIHESISKLKRLILLNLKDCRSLRSLSRKIGELRSLCTLDISGCSNLQHLPVELSMLNSMKELRADGVTFTKTWVVINEQVRAWDPFWSLLSKPKSVVSWSFLPSTLVRLSLADCDLSDDAFTVDLKGLSALEKFDVSGNPIQSLPQSFRRLANLRSFNVSNCTRLKSLIGLPKIQKLKIIGCTSLETVTYESTLSYIPRIARAYDNDSLVTLQGVFKLHRLENVDPEMLSYFDLDVRSTADAEVKVDHQVSERTFLIQGLHEQGIFSIFLPGNWIPKSFLKTTSRSFSFNISPQVMKVKGLSIVIFYISEENKKIPYTYWCANRVEICNRTKDLQWIHRPTIFGMPEDGRGMSWLSHWKFGSLLEAGDELIIQVSLEYLFSVKEVGLCLNVHDENDFDDDFPPDPKMSDHGFFISDVVPGDVSQPGKTYRVPTWY